MHIRTECADIFIFPINLLFAFSIKKKRMDQEECPVFLGPQFAARQKMMLLLIIKRRKIFLNCSFQVACLITNFCFTNFPCSEIAFS